MLKLRRVVNRDLDTLVNLKDDAFQEEFKKYGFVPQEMISYEWHKDMMDRSIYYSIIYNDKIIGGVNIFKSEKGCYLCSLFIDSKMQNKGLGTKVIRLLEEIHDDADKWQLETPAMSVQNHHFYEKCGYIHIKNITPEGAPKGFTLRLYEKTIE